MKSFLILNRIKSDAELSDKADDSPVNKAPSSPSSIHHRKRSPSPEEDLSDEEKQRRLVRFFYEYLYTEEKLIFFRESNVCKKMLQHDWLVFETVGDKNLLNKNLLRVVETVSIAA